MSRVPYASALGSLLYEMVCTRPNIAHVVEVLSRFMLKPRKKNWKTMNWVFRYLRNTSDYGFFYQGRLGFYRIVDIHGFVDAN